MRKLLRTVLPTSRVGMLFFAWRNRYRLLDGLNFVLRALSSVVGGRGLTDAKAELRLRAALARDMQTRGSAIDVRVIDGVCTLTGQVTPEAHARVQDRAAAVPGISRVDDHLVNVSVRRRGVRLRTA